MEDSLRASLQGLKIVDQARRTKGWNRQSLSWAQAALTSLSTLKQFWRRERIQRETFVRICEVVGISNWRDIADERPGHQTMLDWGEAPELSFFCGRGAELKQLQGWILDERCKLAAVLGLGGMGKTTLTVRLIEQIHPQFEYVIWRSLRHAPPLKELLLELIQFLASPQQKPMNRIRRILARRSQEPVQPELSDLEGQDPFALLTLLLSQLRDHRCLIVLDDVEELLQGGTRVGSWRQGFEGYAELIGRASLERHQSCLMLVGREPPKELNVLAEDRARVLPLQGLSQADSREILTKTGIPAGSSWQTIIEHYSGNPLTLKLVAATIRNVLQGQVEAFLRLLGQDPFVFADVRDLWQWHFERLSEPEREVAIWLSIAQHPLSVAELQAELLSAESQAQLLNTLESLRRRSLLQLSEQGLTMQPVLSHYIGYRLSELLQAELTTWLHHGSPNGPLWHTYRLSLPILKPLIEKLRTDEQLLTSLPELEIVLRNKPRKGYAASNLTLFLSEVGFILD